MKGRSVLPTAEDKPRAVRAMFDRIAGRYDLVNRVMTFGMDVGWRRRSVRALGLPRGSFVIDLACGTGDLCRELARASYRAAGIDFSHEMLRAARTDAPLVEGDILRLPFADRVATGATCGFALRNVDSLERLFTEIARVVRPGGRIALLEVSQPRNAVLRAGHRFYSGTVVPWIGGMLSDRQAYEYLPASVVYLPARERLLGMLRAAGFPDANTHPLSAGIAQLITGTRA